MSKKHGKAQAVQAMKAKIAAQPIVPAPAQPERTKEAIMAEMRSTTEPKYLIALGLELGKLVDAEEAAERQQQAIECQRWADSIAVEIDNYDALQQAIAEAP
mgnify:CR=1 FL=1